MLKCAFTSTTFRLLRSLASRPSPAFLPARQYSSQLPPFRKMGDTSNPVHYPAKATAAPDPEWSWGTGMRDPEWKAQEAQGWKTWTTEGTEPMEMYRLLVSSVIPRPIAFVSTVSTAGQGNLAPFSYFSLVNNKPPMVTITVGVGKDTHKNIMDTKEFVVNMVSEPFVHAMNSTAVDGPPELDEWQVSGLTPLPSETVKPARVSDSAVSFECTLFSHTALSEGWTLFVGRISRVHVRRAVLAEGEKTVDPALLKPICRLHANWYARLGEMYEIPRPSWKRGDREGIEAVVGKVEGTGPRA